MKTNLSDHQFLEGGDIIVVQTTSDQDYTKVDTKNVRVESLREDIRNYVDDTTTKKLKVFRSKSTVAGGDLKVLDNETLYYYPSTPTGELDDVNINLTTDGEEFFSTIYNQREYNEKMHKFASDSFADIELTLDGTNKFLDAIVASTEFVGDDDAPDHVKHFTTYDAYPPSDTETESVVNVNDLTGVEQQSIAGDINLQKQIDDAERRITALFNVKIDSGYFVYNSADPTTDLPGPGQVNFKSGNSTDAVFSIHARSYDSSYNGSLGENLENCNRLNNYIVINPDDSVVTLDNTYKVTTVSVVDEDKPIDEKIFIVNATLITSNNPITDGDYTLVRVVSDGEFDPASLDGIYVKTSGDDMNGGLTIGTDGVILSTTDADGNTAVEIHSDGKTTTTATSFGSQDYVTKNYVDETLSSADLDAYVKKTGDRMSGHLEIRGNGADGELSRLKCNILDSGQQSNLTLKRNDVSGISINNGSNSLHQQTTLDKEGSSDKHLITKKYVDDKITTHDHSNKYVKSGSSDSSPQNLRIWKSGSLYYIS